MSSSDSDIIIVTASQSWSDDDKSSDIDIFLDENAIYDYLHGKYGVDDYNESSSDTSTSTFFEELESIDTKAWLDYHHQISEDMRNARTLEVDIDEYYTITETQPPSVPYGYQEENIALCNGNHNLVVENVKDVFSECVDKEELFEEYGIFLKQLDKFVHDEHHKQNLKVELYTLYSTFYQKKTGVPLTAAEGSDMESDDDTNFDEYSAFLKCPMDSSFIT